MCCIFHTIPKSGGREHSACVLQPITVSLLLCGEYYSELLSLRIGEYVWEWKTIVHTHQSLTCSLCVNLHQKQQHWVHLSTLNLRFKISSLKRWVGNPHICMICQMELNHFCDLCLKLSNSSCSRNLKTAFTFFP